MSPLQFMQRLAALVPRPRLHTIRFHGLLAPNAKLRPVVVPKAPEVALQAIEAAAAAGCEPETVQARPHHISRHPIPALHAVAARSSGLTWALLRAVETPMLATHAVLWQDIAPALGNKALFLGLALFDKSVPSQEKIQWRKSAAIATPGSKRCATSPAA